MPRLNQQQIEERYEKLPEVLKEAMFDPDITDTMFETGKKFGLTIDKIGYLAEETGYVILGFTKSEDFIKALKDNLDIDEEKARQIGAEINQRVFLALREALKQTHKMEIPEEARIPAPEQIRYGADKSQELRVEPPKSATMTPLLPAAPVPPKIPAEPTKQPMPIDLRELRKPTPSSSLPEIIGPAKSPELKLREPPKPTAAKPPETLKPVIPKPAAPPKPEVMATGGIFAAPLPMSKPPTPAIKPIMPAPQPQKMPKEIPSIEKNNDPYREPIE